MNGNKILDVYQNLKVIIPDYLDSITAEKSEYTYFDRLLNKNIFEIPENKIKSGGYVIETLEASIWCLLTTKNYKDAVLKAVNLAGDSDTTGCVTGGLAGLYYGYDNIPDEWVNKLVKREEIDDLSERLFCKFAAFEDCFGKLLNDILEACELFADYFHENDRMFEDIQSELQSIQESKKKLLAKFKEKTNNINLDISVMESRIIGGIENIEFQNEKIEDLIYCVIIIKGNHLIKGLDSELHNIKEKIAEWIRFLEEKIINYIKNAKKEKTRKLITVEEALKKHTDIIINSINRSDFWD
jgi:hypothetical protein